MTIKTMKPMGKPISGSIPRLPIMQVWSDEVILYVDSETAYKFSKIVYRMLHKMKRKDEMEGEVK